MKFNFLSWFKEEKMFTYTLEQAAKLAEEKLGSNLQRLTDILDLHIRQRDPIAISILADLELAHIALCKAGAHKLTCETH